MDVILLIVHVCLALVIITLILLQKGKGASEGATFGGGGSAGSVFGASGSSNFLSKTTAILATCFFLNSLALAYLAANRDEQGSVLDAIESSMESVDVEQMTESFDGSVPLPADVPADSGVPTPADAPVESDVPVPVDVPTENDALAPADAAVKSNVPSTVE